MPSSHEPLTEPLAAAAFWAGDPHPHLARMQEEAPLAWNDEVGFWAVLRHADVLEVSKDPERFCLSRGVLLADLNRHFDNPGALLYVDPPDHTRYRRVIQPAFSPSRVRDLVGDVRSRAAAIIDRSVVAGEPLDVVPDLAVPFPLVIIAELLGVDVDMWPQFRAWSDAAIAAAEEITDETTASMIAMSEYFLGLIEDRAARPGDDLVSVVATTETDGERLDDGEMLMLLVQLLVAGNETTRNLISAGLAALAAHPDQWARLRADRTLVEPAVEELLRWTSPVISFLRTATRDTRLGGTRIDAGDALLLTYAAANRDPRTYGESAQVFDVGRSDNHQVAFGFGTHYCLGALLARIEGRVVLEELLDRFEFVEPAGAVVRIANTAIAGIESAPLCFR